MTSLSSAHTLSSSSVSSPFPELSTPPPSQHSFLQVPDVFVIPPEEEHEDNPPFCCYDAAAESKQALSISPDIEALDAALNFHQQTDNRAPAFHRSFGNESQDTIIMPRRSESSTRDIAREVVKSSSDSRQTVLDDSDVVEVVKVRRNEGMHTDEEIHGFPLKSSKSFRARASQAFKSIRNMNVGKSGRKASGMGTGAENVGPITEDGMHPRPSTPGLSRRKSIQLSRLFSSTRSTRSPYGDVPPASPSPSAASTSSEWSAISRPSPVLGDRTNASRFAQSPEPHDRPVLASKQSFRHRISAVDLRGLFKPSTSVKVATPTSTHFGESILPSLSASYSESLAPRSSSSSSTMLHNLSDAFSDTSSHSPLHSFPSDAPQLPLTLSASASISHGLTIQEVEDVEMGDDDLELRLDSLHFDSLHFDPEEFL